MFRSEEQYPGAITQVMSTLTACLREGCFRPLHRDGMCRVHHKAASRRGPCADCKQVRGLYVYEGRRICQACRTEAAQIPCVVPGCERYAIYRLDLTKAVCPSHHYQRHIARVDTRICLACKEPRGIHARGRCARCYHNWLKSRG